MFKGYYMIIMSLQLLVNTLKTVLNFFKVLVLEKSNKGFFLPKIDSKKVIKH